MDYTVHEILQTRIQEWVAFPFSRGGLSNPGIEPRSLPLQVDSVPAEPQGKPKSTGVGSLSLLQQIFSTQESNWGLLHCRQILYQLSYLFLKIKSHPIWMAFSLLISSKAIFSKPEAITKENLYPINPHSFSKSNYLFTLSLHLCFQWGRGGNRQEGYMSTYREEEEFRYHSSHTFCSPSTFIVTLSQPHT